MNKLVRLKCQNMYKTCSHTPAGSFTNLGTGVRINWGSESPPAGSQRDLFGSCACNLRINWMDFSPYCNLSVLQTNYTDWYNKRNVYRAFCVYYKGTFLIRFVPLQVIQSGELVLFFSKRTVVVYAHFFFTKFCEAHNCFTGFSSLQKLIIRQIIIVTERVMFWNL